ncbi:Derlin-like_protein [Hexamita inflata]|uniref:Derlin n=1 Tax=Hexamita inflata TaxID=28002 RepID=A0AA86P769_9EUKA|nr:Derlin-like protein [Hexamita inflata]
MQDLLRNTPPITLVVVSISIGLSLLASLKIISPFSISLDWFGIQRGEYYRLITGFLFFGPISLNWIFFVSQNIKYISALEKESYAGKKKELILLIVYTWICTLLLSRFVAKMSYAAMPFFSVLSYVWTKKHRDQIFVAFGFLHFPASYLPVFNVVVAVMQQQSLLVPIFGILVGHIWWFIDDVVPGLTGVDLIRKIAKTKK